MAHHGRAGVGAVVLAVALAGLSAGCSRSVASASTTLRRVVAATVEHRDGRVEPATDGMRVRPGDVVRTDPVRGQAWLATLDRVVYLGPAAIVSVADGGRQQLRSGAIVVDARHGDGLTVAVAGFSVRVARGAVRVERGFATRVGVLVGSARVDSAAGRDVRVAALHQVVAVGDALPDRTAPLRLTGDAAERRVAPALVADDDRLAAVARGIDATSSSNVVSVVAAAWGHTVPAVSTSAPTSERILPVAIATAAHAGAAEVYADRADGGSWGVVAHLSGTDGDGALAALDALERGVPVTALGPVNLAAAVAAVPLAVPGGRGPRATAPTTTPTARPSGSSGGGSGSPAPSPSSSPDLVTTVVDTVEKLLPTPPPLPVPTASPVLTLPTAPALPLGH